MAVLTIDLNLYASPLSRDKVVTPQSTFIAIVC